MDTPITPPMQDMVDSLELTFDQKLMLAQLKHNNVNLDEVLVDLVMKHVLGA